MTRSRISTYSFTKLIVDDLEKMASFYSEVYDLDRIEKIHSEIGPDAIDEVLLGVGDQAIEASLILLRFVDKPRPRNGEVILGFMTDDLPALLDRVRAAGGGVHAGIVEHPEMKLRVAFATDPEGHLAEIVEMGG